MNVQAIAQNIRKNTHPTRGRPNHRSWSCASPCPQGCLGSNIHPDRIPLWPNTPDSPGGWFPSQGEWSACCEKPASPTRIEKWEKHCECRGAPVQPSSWAPLPRTHRPTDPQTERINQWSKLCPAPTFKNSNRSRFLSNSRSWFFCKLSTLSERKELECYLSNLLEKNKQNGNFICRPAG